MFNFLKKKNKNTEVSKHIHDYRLNNQILNDEMQEIIYNRAIDIIKNDNILIPAMNLGIVVQSELIRSSSAIYDRKATIDDVIAFADEYGCTIDYLLGRTDTPYYTL